MGQRHWHQQLGSRSEGQLHAGGGGGQVAMSSSSSNNNSSNSSGVRQVVLGEVASGQHQLPVLMRRGPGQRWVGGTRQMLTPPSSVVGRRMRGSTS
jgi:hypothetical protein